MSPTEPVAAGASATAVAGLRVPLWLLAVLLALATIVLYWPAMDAGFVNFDDGFYVTSNARVQSGVTLEGIKWAFFNPVCYMWHPLTVLSHMLDCQFFGLKPWGHHLTSVLLHALNTMLVLLLLRRLTGAIWRSLLVAALFGWHPLQVESVAWVAERKNVLSTCFGLLALLFYARYAEVQSQRGKVQGPKSKVQSQAAGIPAVQHGSRTTVHALRSTLHAPRYYVLSLLFFALGLMSKPMLVTWPFVLLLIDYWPLNRIQVSDVNLHSRNLRRLVMEKIPFFALAAVTCVVTFMVQKQGGILASADTLPLGARGGNALISYCRYLGKLFWPIHLAVLYPHPGRWPVEKVLLAGVLLLGLSVLFFVQRRRYPFLLMGWLWYCGTLLPVIQLVQTGTHAMADRYAYVPSLGVLIAAIYGAAELLRNWRYRAIALSGMGAVAIVLCLRLTRQQLEYWQDSEALSRHALEVTENNPMAHYLLGNALADRGQIDEAIRQYQEAIRLQPGYAEYHYNLGSVLARSGQTGEAIRQLQEALRLQPDNVMARLNLGNALDESGQIDEAIRQYQEALRLQPDNAMAHLNLGISFATKGQIDDAIRQYQEALRMDPGCAEASDNLARALEKKNSSPGR